MKTPKRLSEINFLRGIAVILVLFHHHWFFDYPTRFGWIGVDLFFVLSGYLVSGLLFAEYQEFGQIDSKRFLIRRAFKIYPLFYISITATFIIFVFFTNDYLNWKGIILKFLPEVTFTQNYFTPIWGHHWSLAVEEHFYLLLVLLIHFLVKRDLLKNRKAFFIIAGAVFVLPFLLRGLSITFFPHNTNLEQTQFRMDSLFAGVLIAYLKYFEGEWLRTFYIKHKYLIFALAILGIMPALFTDPENLGFIRSADYTFNYISFSSLLLIFIFTENIAYKLSRIFTKPVYWIVTKIGIYSYGIYVFHEYYLVYADHLQHTGDFSASYQMNRQIGMDFAMYIASALVLGILFSRNVEIPFLKIRDRYFPRDTM